MNKFKRSAALLFTLLALCGWTESGTLERWGEFARSKDKPLFMKWLKNNARSLFMKEKDFAPLTITLPAVYGNAGLFITIMKKGKVRGCFGAFDHGETDMSLLLRNYLKGALSYDPRYKPLERYELDEMEIVVTIASQPEPVESLNNVDIGRFGVFIDCEGEAGRVIVPAEFKTSSRLDRNNKYNSCRINRFRAVTIREER